MDAGYLETARTRYAWPGGYELYAVTDDGGTLCAPCVVTEWDTITASDPGDGWYIVAWDHTGNTDDGVTCDHCARVVQEPWDDGATAGDGDGDDGDHVHVWGPLERSRFAGTIHRKCYGCRVVSIGDDDGGDDDTAGLSARDGGDTAYTATEWADYWLREWETTRNPIYWTAYVDARALVARETDNGTTNTDDGTTHGETN